jgi:hypothetical protein
MGALRLRAVAVLALSIIFGLLFGCSEDVYLGTRKANIPPEVWLSSGPVEGTTTGYKVHFYWGGWDPDGEIAYFEFVIVDGSPIGFNRQDTTGLDKWTQTNAYDSTFSVTADDSSETVIINNNPYTRYDRTHTFFLRGVDAEGVRSAAQYRSFTAWTLAPTVIIESPGDNAVLGRVITFSWTGRDPIDEPLNTQDPESVRFVSGLIIDTNGVENRSFDIMGDFNENPWRYEHMWQGWIYYNAPNDSGRSTTIGDDEILQLNKSHFFAVQAKDEAGAVTAIFDTRMNFRRFIVSESAGPFLTVTEPFLGSFRFIGRDFTPVKRDLPPGVPLNFHWIADAEEYGGRIVGYRYGWDIADVNNPSDWPVTFSPFNLAAPERAIYSGTHTFFIEALDNAGTTTLGQIQINTIPFDMNRQLLWVDDFYSVDFTQVSWSMPTETQHDQFWTGICSRAVGFDPELDIYDVAKTNFKPPRIERIGKYKNLIWTYSSDDRNAWAQIVRFVPESSITEGTQLTINYLSLFLAKGGHLLSCGRSEKGAGLAAVLPPLAMTFPMNIKCEILGNQDGCEGDTSGVNTMAYKHYCVTVLDKVVAQFRTDNLDMPYRDTSVDALYTAYKDNSEPYNAFFPDLPEALPLWEEITKPDRFFDPRIRGFPYVEIYNPEYWMDITGSRTQACFTPMYRMKTRSSLSAVNNTVIALWLNKYEDVVPDIPAESGVGVAAPSVHFGFPLWFFDHDAVNQITDILFAEWGLLAE